MVSTSELMAGEQVALVDFGATKRAYRHQLQCFGITSGVSVRVIRKAPLGCPIQIEVRGVSFMLRVQEAQDLVWKRL